MTHPDKPTGVPPRLTAEAVTSQVSACSKARPCRSKNAPTSWLSPIRAIRKSARSTLPTPTATSAGSGWPGSTGATSKAANPTTTLPTPASALTKSSLCSAGQHPAPGRRDIPPSRSAANRADCLGPRPPRATQPTDVIRGRSENLQCETKIADRQVLLRVVFRRCLISDYSSLLQ